jgi:hypothetical protein
MVLHTDIRGVVGDEELRIEEALPVGDRVDHEALEGILKGEAQGGTRHDHG